MTARHRLSAAHGAPRHRGRRSALTLSLRASGCAARARPAADAGMPGRDRRARGAGGGAGGRPPRTGCRTADW